MKNSIKAIFLSIPILVLFWSMGVIFYFYPIQTAIIVVSAVFALLVWVLIWLKLEEREIEKKFEKLKKNF